VFPGCRLNSPPAYVASVFASRVFAQHRHALHQTWPRCDQRGMIEPPRIELVGAHNHFVLGEEGGKIRSMGGGEEHKVSGSPSPVRSNDSTSWIAAHEFRCLLILTMRVFSPGQWDPRGVHCEYQT